jgi:hypothetical protein
MYKMKSIYKFRIHESLSLMLRWWPEFSKTWMMLCKDSHFLRQTRASDFCRRLSKALETPRDYQFQLHSVSELAFTDLFNVILSPIFRCGDVMAVWPIMIFYKFCLKLFSVEIWEWISLKTLIASQPANAVWAQDSGPWICVRDPNRVTVQ